MAALADEFGPRVESERIGITETPSGQYKRYATLRSIATEVELRALTSHDNPTVRVYATMALAEKKRPLRDVLLARLNDGAKFERQEGCVVDESTVVDTLLQRVWASVRPADRRTIAKRALSRSAIETAWPIVLPDLQPTDADRTRLVEMIRKTKGASLVPLARLGTPADRAHVSTALRDDDLRSAALEAVRAVPHDDYLASIATIVDDVDANGIVPLYRAVATYHRDDVLPLLDRIVRRLPASRVDPVFVHHGQTIDETFDARYTPVYWTMVRSGQLLTPKILDHLGNEDDDRLRRTIHERLRTQKNPDAPATALLLAELERIPNDPELIGTLGKLIGHAGPATFDGVAEVVARYRHDDLVAPLLALAKTSDNPHQYLAATRLLLAYRRPALKQQLREILAARKKRGDDSPDKWGHNAFEDLLDGKSVE